MSNRTELARYRAKLQAERDGAAITRITRRGVLYTGLRQLVFGYGAASITYGIGRLIGVSLGG